MSGGEVLEKMESNLVPAGKGRPMKLPQDLQPTNRVFLQLGLLERRHSVPEQRLHSFACILLPSVKFGEGGALKVRTVIRRVFQEAAGIAADGLERFLDTSRDVTRVGGNYCGDVGLTADVLRGETIPALDTGIKNGLVLELEFHRKKTGVKDVVFQEWLLQLSPQLRDLQLNTQQIHRKVQALVKRHKDKQKTGGQPHISLLEQTFQDFVLSTNMGQRACGTSKTSEETTPLTVTPSTTSAGSCQCQECGTMLTDLRMLKAENQKFQCKIEELQREEELMKVQLETLKSCVSHKQTEIDELKATLEKSNSDLRKEKDLSKTLQDKLDEKKKNSAALARNANNVERQKENMVSTHEQLKSVSSKLKATEQKLLETEADLQTKETKLESQRRQTYRQRQKEATLNLKALALEAEVKKLADECEASFKPVVLRQEKGYTPAVQACVIELIGHEVAAERVGSVMKSVLSHLGILPNVQISDLPSKSTCLRFADIGHVLSKLQIQEELKKQLFDLHVDGTSKDHRKLVGHQVTLESGRQMALGFTSVDREDTTTLITITMNLMQEIASIGSESKEDAEDILKDIFRHMVATMTDRAATMKSFGRSLKGLKMEVLADDAGLDFLFCNAHFLLGMATGTTQGLEKFEKTEGFKGKLGRDADPCFLMFKKTSKDPAAVRLIRMACDVLGPRGDEKNGCQQDWSAYLGQQEKSNCVGSFRANRFNNLFQSAAALVHHKPDIIDFFSNYSNNKSLNMKLKSVLVDTKDTNIMLMVTALAVVYICVAGPFWVLINSPIHYLDLYKYVQNMSRNLEHISQDKEAAQAMLTTLPSLLEDFPVRNSPVMTSVKEATLDFEDNDHFFSLLQTLAAEYLDVIRRQLNDFLLPNGKYSQAPTDADRERLAHCKMTNLFGEASFGDLDFSMNKRRNSSLHHHSSLIMQKRNDSAAWCRNKSAEEQSHLLSIAKAESVPMRKRHREMEEEEKRKGRERVEKRKKEKIQKDLAMEQRRKNIIEAVQKNGGLWTSAAQVREGVAACRTLGAKKTALRDQIIFHKIIFVAKDPLLTMAKKTVRELTNCVCEYVEKWCQNKPDFAQTLPADMSSTNSSPSRTPSTKEVCLPPLFQGESSDASTDPPRTSQFTHQGQKVAVFYRDRFHVGEVVNILSPGKAQVNFMHPWGNRNAFRWPDCIQTDEVISEDVLVWDLKMYTSNGRVWLIEDFNSVVTLHRQWRSVYGYK